VNGYQDPGVQAPTRNYRNTSEASLIMNGLTEAKATISPRVRAAVSSFMGMGVGSRGMFVSELAVFVSRGCVLLGLFVLANCVVMLGLMMMMMMGGSVVVSGREMMMLTRRMFRCSVTVPSAVPPFLHDIEPWCSN
jgi:hypothetical protein